MFASFSSLGRDAPQHSAVLRALQSTGFHDLLCLFNLLSGPTRERLEAMWRDHVQCLPAETTEPFEKIGVRIEPELTAALATGRRAFQRIRYLHEESGEDFVFYLGALPKMLKKVAFELRPDWAEPC
jgi:hypothetical protein